MFKDSLLFSPEGLKAMAFATNAHKGQVRKYTGEPYITHPIAVASIVLAQKDVSLDMVLAAVLHDVIEDCHVTEAELASEFNPRVAYMVALLSQDKSDPAKSRAQRKLEYRTQLKSAPGQVHTIKLADMLHNGPSIIEHAPEFAKVWMAEASDMWDVLGKGSENLRFKVQLMLVRYASENQLKLIAQENP